MMDSPTSVAVAAVVGALAIWIVRQRRPSHYPPGPPCLPIFGSALSMPLALLHVRMEAWREKYGNIFSFSLGSSHFIVLNQFKLIKEALVHQSTDFAGRPGATNVRIQHFTTNFPTLGISDSTYSEEWRNQRSVAMKILRSLGYGKSKLEEQIRAECSSLRHSLEARKGKPTNPSSLLRTSTCNVICSLLYGERFENSDPEFKKLENIMNRMAYGFFAHIDCDFIWLLSLKPAYKKTLKDLYEAYGDLNKFHAPRMKERHERMANNGYSEPSDYIEHYICEQNKSEGSRKLGENWMSGMANELFLGGADSSSAALNWAILWMAARPDVQEKAYKEVSMATGGDPSVISLELRNQCPYLEATTMEVMRVSPLEPVVGRTANSDFKFHGYTVPKDSTLFINIYSVLNDPELWTEPEKFIPERHIEEGRVVHGPGWIPFSMGRRSCLGEQLTRQQTFLFFATVVSSFKIRLPEGHKINLAPWDQGLMKPHPYEVIFEPRN